jgi:inner membrane protein
MDPLTQGLIGAAAAQGATGGRLPRAWLVGMLAGMAPDLDVLIRSNTDPLLATEFHRHFTHALLFIPVGGLICALPWLLLQTYRERWRLTLLAATLAVATHGLLDACTSYGTQLLWPFSNARVGWDWISIIDPLFTLCLLAGVIRGALRGTRVPALAGMALATGYMAFGALQHSRALTAQEGIAAARGHAIEHGEAFATIGNNLVWRSLYRSGNHIHADRIRVSWLGNVQWTPGSRVARVTAADLPGGIRDDARALRDFERFSWFSGGWVALHPDDPSVYGDVRYSLRTNAFDPIWGIRLHPGRDVPVEWISRTRDRQLSLADLWREIMGSSPDYRPLAAVMTP